MAFAPIALTIPQYENYPNNWLKAYEQGTTTPLSMATDATGSTLLVKCELDATGFPVTAGSARFIPFIQGDYDLWLFPTSVEADANDTTNAIQFADNLNTSVPDNNISYTVSSKSDALALTLIDGRKVFITSVPDGGDFIMKTGAVVGTYNDNAASAYTGTKFTGGDGSTGFIRDFSSDKINPKWFGATGDGITDDTAAIENAQTASHALAGLTLGGGTVRFQEGIYKHSGLTLSTRGARLTGDNWRSCVLYYTGTTSAITISSVACTVDYLHITGLDPTTTNHLIGNNAGIGNGTTGILSQGVDAQIKNNTISYFNNATNKAAAIKTNDASCFSNTMKNNYIAWCWGGISLEDTITDTNVTDNTIINVEKYGISVGYDWNASAQTSFTGDNFRIRDNQIGTVNRGYSTGGNVGDGFGIYLSRGSVFNIEGNYIEDVYAQTGSTSYGIYANGVTDGTKLLALNIHGNNVATGFSGTKYNVWLEKCYYGNSSGNHFEGISGGVNQVSDSKWFIFGSNFFTGSISSPYALAGENTFAFDGPNSKVTASSNSGQIQEYDVKITKRFSLGTRTVADGDATPAVNAGNVLLTSNTSPTTLTALDSGDAGVPVFIIFGDANTTVDFTGSNLKGNNGADWSPALNDHMTCITVNAVTWFCTISNN